MAAEAFLRLDAPTSDARNGSRLSVSPPRNLYDTSDGHYLATSASRQARCEKLFMVIPRTDMITDPRFTNNDNPRVKAREVLVDFPDA